MQKVKSTDKIFYEKKFRIRIKDCIKIRNCHKLKMFAGRVVIAEKTPAGNFAFSSNISSGFWGVKLVSSIISPRFADVIG